MSTGQFSFAPGAGETKQFGLNLNEVMNYTNTAPVYAAIVQAEFLLWKSNSNVLMGSLL